MIDKKKMEILEARFLKNPKSILFARLADYYLQQNRVDEAIHLCMEGIKYHPYYITGNFILAKAYVAANEYDKAEEALKKVLSHDRQHLAAHELLAQLMKKLGWENKAAVHYKEILKIDPLNNQVRQELNDLTGYEAEYEEPPPIVADTEEDLPSSGIQTQSSSDDKPWMKKLEEAFPKHFPEEPETPAAETLSPPPEETAEKISMDSLISEAETIIDKNKESKTLSESTEGIHEIETEDISEADQTGQAIEEKEEELFNTEEEGNQNTIIEEEKPLEETVNEDDLFEEAEIEPEQKETQNQKEEPFFESLTSESEQDINPDVQQKTDEEENLFEESTRETEQEQTREDEDEILFEPIAPDSEKTIVRPEQQETVKEEDLFEPPSSKAPHKKSHEEIEEPEKEDAFFEPELPEIEETPKEDKKKTGKHVPEKKPGKHKKEPSAPQKDTVSEQETEESGFFYEVTEPEVPKEDKTEKPEPPEPEKSEPDEKAEKGKQEEKEVPPPVEENEKEKPPEPEPKIKDNEPETPKKESPPVSEKDKKKTKIMTPTLGEIYAAQGQFDKAIKVYENLLEKAPDNKHYQGKIEELKKKLKDAK